ncbi:hypothetical protein COK10_19870 [Bacillus anthracis]|nr:hypothetical protein COK10_19870 [Bacillus anthracis]
MEDFLNLSIEERVEFVNNMLAKEEKDALRNVAKRLNINYSTFTKIMQEGDYIYVKRRNKYFKFIDEEQEEKNNTDEFEYLKEVNFIREHMNDIKRILNTMQSTLILNEEIYHKDAKVSVKSIKVNEEVYSKFARLCDDKFNHLKIKDIISQALLNFYNTYNQEGE